MGLMAAGDGMQDRRATVLRAGPRSGAGGSGEGGWGDGSYGPPWTPEDEATRVRETGDASHGPPWPPEN
jgi:hypothetical protein